MISRTEAEHKFDQVTHLVDQLNRYVHEAARDGKPIHEVERRVWDDLLKIGHSALGQFIDAQGIGDLGDTFTMSNGQIVKRLGGLHRRTYRSIFGSFDLERAVYGSREGQTIEFVPLDQRLELPESGFSYVLQDWSQALGVEHAYGRVSETLEMILGSGQSVDSLERMNRQMAQDVEGFRDQACPPMDEDDEEGEILVISVDNKGIPMRRPADQKPVGSHRKKGEKANKKQQATVGVVYSVDVKQRTAEDVVAGLFRDDVSYTEEPVAEHKRFWASLNREQNGKILLGEDLVFEPLVQELADRCPDGSKPVVCLMDGQRSLWTALARHLPNAEVVQILDLIHVTPRLWDAAHLFHPEGSEAASYFVRCRLSSILNGQVGYVTGGIRQMGTKHRLRGKKLTKLSTICEYLQKNRHRMKYDEYLFAGYPIASGVIEGACRHVVKDRMERSGMRWTVKGAQAMLDLRTTYINEQWDELQTYRINEAKRRLYPDQMAIQTLEWPMAA